MIWLFRWGRNPLFVPWEQVSVRPARSFKIFRIVIFSFEGFPEVQMQWYFRDWQRATKEFSEVWPPRLLKLAWPKEEAGA